MISSPEADPESAGKGADAGEELTLRTPPILFDHYEILSRVGAGGMGEVYVATDIRLGRKVALKILPVELTNDADRIRRLEQEARTASALNHPNIVTVHELGRAGSSSTGRKKPPDSSSSRADDSRRNSVRGASTQGSTDRIRPAAPRPLGRTPCARATHAAGR